MSALSPPNAPLRLMPSVADGNAGHQAQREAEAERKLYAVACMPLFDQVLPSDSFMHWPVQQKHHGKAQEISSPPTNP